MTAQASVIPDGAKLSFTIPGGHEQTIEYADFLTLLEAVDRADSNVGLTADAGSSQGDGLITAKYNVYSVVGTDGDAATLPEFPVVGQLVYVKNDDAAEQMEVFPFLGQDAGLGDDTPIVVVEGTGVVFMCTVADLTWTQLLPPS